MVIATHPGWPSDRRHHDHHLCRARAGFVSVGDADLWFEQRGEGPDVLLLAGLTDPLESWTFQLEGLADRYRVTAFDNRGAGRSPMPPTGSPCGASPTTPPV